MDGDEYYCGTCRHGILYAYGCSLCEQQYLEKEKARQKAKEEKKKEAKEKNNG